MRRVADDCRRAECAVGAPTALRAVGAANGQNPVAIIVPCHRVIGSDGSLTGYGGGLPRKAWLLGHEGVLEPELPLGDPGATATADDARSATH